MLYINYLIRLQSKRWKILTWIFVGWMLICEFSHKTLVTSSSTALLLCCMPAGAPVEALFSSDAALLNLEQRTCFWSCLKEGFEDGNIPPDEPKALALARVIRAVGSSTLAAVLFSFFIIACLVEEQCMTSKWNILHWTCTSKTNSMWENRKKQLTPSKNAM